MTKFLIALFITTSQCFAVVQCKSPKTDELKMWLYHENGPVAVLSHLGLSQFTIQYSCEIRNLGQTEGHMIEYSCAAKRYGEDISFVLILNTKKKSGDFKIAKDPSLNYKDLECSVRQDH